MGGGSFKVSHAPRFIRSIIDMKEEVHAHSSSPVRYSWMNETEVRVRHRAGKHSIRPERTLSVGGEAVNMWRREGPRTLNVNTLSAEGT